MNMPFTVEQFLGVFGRYNLSVWPMQVILNLIGVAAIILAVKRTVCSNRCVAIILSVLWLWIGIVYHFLFFTTINQAAYGFTVLCVLQGVLLLLAGVFRQQLSFQYHTDAYGIMGGLLILYAMVIYPILGYFLGHIYPQAPTFGLPCPTTIFTFGLLLWTDVRVPKYVLIIPFLWSLIGFSAAASLGIREDFGLLIAGLIATTMIVLRDRSFKHSASVRRIA